MQFIPETFFLPILYFFNPAFFIAFFLIFTLLIYPNITNYQRWAAQVIKVALQAHAQVL